MPDPAQESLTLPVLGMSCSACQHHVEKTLRATSGVLEARVDLMAHRASIQFDPATASVETIVAAIRSAGFDAVPPRPGEEAARPEAGSGAAEGKAAATLLGGAAVMILMMPLGGSMGPIDHALMSLLPWLYALPAAPLRWGLLLATLVLLLWAGRGVYTNALRGLRHGATNMNTLVSLGTSVAFLYSAYATLWPAPGRAVYFDAVLLIIGFLLLGKALEGRAKRRALTALESLSRLRPATARRVKDGVQEEIPLGELQVGESVLVLPGERFPVDAVVLEGRTSVDESMLTGEPTPLLREPGGRVLAGSLNYDGAVLCRAESLGEETVLAQIARMASEAQGSRAPMERLADRASAVFVPVVLGLAVVTFLAWLLATGSLPMALATMVDVLVIACPCAMGLAVPAALTVAVGRGAQLGVLFKGGEALERLAHLDAIALDKTGTITVGHPTLTAIRTLGGLSEEQMLELAAAAEERSNHPLAHAIVDAARERGLSWPAAELVQALPGRGLSAQLSGRPCLLGNATLFADSFLKLPEDQPDPAPGVTRLWMAVDGAVAGYFDAKDSLRPDAAQAVTALRQMGLRVLLLTGDTAAAAAPITREAGIEEVEAALDPAGKLQRIRKLQSEGVRVAMAGDGVNDAASLAQADAGLAMGTGAELAQEAGDVLLLRAHPSSIPAAIGLARATLRVMRQNLAWAAGYNLVGIPLAAGLFYPFFHILLSPWVAAAAMALSSISVLTNSLRLRGWRAG